MKQIVSFVVVILALVLVGCSDMGTDFPADVAVPFEPPQAYTYWWQDMEACSDHHRNFFEVQWYSVPDTYVFQNNPAIQGMAYTGDGGNIVLLKASFLRTPELVRHEILHMLLQTKGHPRQYFRVSCVDLVVNWPDDGTDN